jgi:cytidine deaminase
MTEKWTDAELLDLAYDAADNAHCPYSNFHVGAVIVGEEQHGLEIVARGCNVENASYGLTICAERAAIFSLVESGLKQFKKLIVVCPDAKPEHPAQYRMPCGACRQVMAEFAAPDAQIIVDGVGVFTMEDLLPKAFKL